MQLSIGNALPPGGEMGAPNRPHRQQRAAQKLLGSSISKALRQLMRLFRDLNEYARWEKGERIEICRERNTDLKSPPFHLEYLLCSYS